MWIALLICALGGIAVSYVGFLGVAGRLRPNRWAGIRTPFTLSTPERWYDTHRAAGPLFVFGGVLVFAAAAAFLPFAAAGAVGDGVVGVLLAVLVVLLGGITLYGWLSGTRHARAEERRRQSDP